jgi:hypothetical protein
MFLDPFSNRAAWCRRGKALPRRKSAARPQSWFRYSAERLPWWPLRVGDSCWHIRRALRPKLTNLIRPSYSSPRWTAVTFSAGNCSTGNSPPQLILPDMDLSLMYHRRTRIWTSSAVLHGKDADDVLSRMTGIEEPVQGGQRRVVAGQSRLRCPLRSRGCTS